MWDWFGSGKRVLAIGSVHLDTIAFSRSATEQDDVTLIGTITHSVGGSAYNVAANLASRHGRAMALRDVAVYTILPQHSVLTEIIRYKIDVAGINSRFVRLYRDFNSQRVRGGGYVGIVDDQQLLRRAVVDAAMHDANIFQDRSERSYLESAIAWADMLVLDADLSVSTVNHVAEHAQDRGKPLFMCIGSPPAGLRGWVHSHDENIATCVGGRAGVLCNMLQQVGLDQAEIDAFRTFVDGGGEPAGFDVGAVCRLLKTKHVVTGNVRQAQGFALIAGGERPYACFLATPEEVRARVQHGNSAGIVDGALSGFITSYARLAQRKQKRHAADAPSVSDATRRMFATHVLDLVEHASQSEGATPGSVISFEEQAREQSPLAKLWRLTKIAFDVLPVFRYLLSIGALIIALWLVETSINVLDYLGYRIELPDAAWVRVLLRR